VVVEITVDVMVTVVGVDVGVDTDICLQNSSSGIANSLI